jgi:hypothetical protein
MDIGDRVMVPSKSGNQVWVLDSGVSQEGGTGREFVALMTPDEKAFRLAWVEDLVPIYWSEELGKFVTVPE